MPYKPKNSKYYKVRLKSLPRYGDTPLLSTRSTSKQTAQAMQNSLRKVYEKGLGDKKYFELLDALKPVTWGASGKITLLDLHYAVQHGELDDLLLSLTSPTITEAVDDFLTFSGEDSKYNRDGMDKLLRLSPGKARGEETRVSYLQNHRNIMKMVSQLEREGLKKSTVERSFLSPLSRFLRFTFGNAERDRIFSEITYKVPQAKPRPLMDAALIAQFLSACEENAKGTTSMALIELPNIARISLLSSADLGTVLKLTPADVQIIHGSHASLHLRGTKKNTRNRTVIVSSVLVPELLKAMDSKAAHEKLFVSESLQISKAWYDMRKRYGLPPFRFKDLRHAFAKHAVMSGMDQSVTKEVMGHSNEQMTRHYAALVAKMKPHDADELAKSMGLFRNDKPLKKVV